MRFIFIYFLFLSFFSSGQIEVNVTIRTIKGKPLKQAKTYLSIGGEKAQQKETDENGKVFYEVIDPGVYTFYYAEDIKGFDIEMRKGRKGKMSKSLSYDPDGVFAVFQKADRSNLTFKEIDQTKVKFKPATGRCGYELILKNSKGFPVNNIPVALADINKKTIYKSNTGPKGIANFYLYSGRNYELDINGEEGLREIKIPMVKYGVFKKVLPYEQPKIVQKIKGDSIYQYKVSAQQRATTHSFLQVTLVDYNRNGLSNEKICLNDENSSTIYVAYTNEQGLARFMIKNGTDYVMHLTHERGVKLLSMEKTTGFKSRKLTHSYRGSLLIEKQLAEQKAEMELLKAKLKAAEEDFASGRAALKVTYNETPVKVISAPEKYLMNTPKGFSLNFGNSGKAGTPTIVGDNLYVQEGLYSSNYFCINATNGKYNWGLRLGETGISPAVYKNGVILINTASCSLYAIDAKTGKLLWSKWLAGYVYTTPSADNENVYVAYNHGGYPVVVSFDLRSGKLNWMRLVDEEIIACPVVVDSEIHVASQNGMYYVYDKKSGGLKKKREDLNAVSTPTISEESIYISVSNGSSENLVALDRKTLETKQTYPTSLTSLRISGLRNVDQTDQMNFNGSHSIIYKNKIAILADKYNLMAFDVVSEKLLWKQKIEVNEDQLPIVANKKAIIMSKAGEIYSFDIQTGSKKFIKAVSGKIEGQPIAKKGFLYIAVGGAIKVIKNAVSYSWLQWNKDGGHNAIWE